jgi:hypothetical protein
MRAEYCATIGFFAEANRDDKPGPQMRAGCLVGWSLVVNLPMLRARLSLPA